MAGDVVLEGEKEREGSAMNPCLIIVDTSLDAIERSKVSNFLEDFPGKVSEENFRGKISEGVLESETRRKTREGRDDNELRVKKETKKILEICYFLGKEKE